MSLVRKQTRKNIMKFLVGRTDARERVTFGKATKQWGENLPSLTLQWRGEVDEKSNQSPKRIKRNLQLEIELTVGSHKDEEDLNDQLDDLAEQVERCLSVDSSLGGCVNDIDPISTTDFATEGDGDKLVGSVKLIYNVEIYEYFPRDRDMQGVQDELLTMEAEWNLGGEQAEADRATDEITLRP